MFADELSLGLQCANYSLTQDTLAVVSLFQFVYSPVASYLALELMNGFIAAFVFALRIEFSFFRLRSSLWLQFKPQQIAAGAAYLAAEFLNMDVALYQNVWKEFQTPPSVLKGLIE